MANDETGAAEEPPKKRSKMGLILGVLLLFAGAGGGFAAVQLGLLGGDDPHVDESHADPVEPLPALTFVPIEPLLISLGARSNSRHLRFAAQLEVAPDYEAEVRLIMPRVVDVLNGYLRAVETADLEDPSSLMRLRAQMLRRIQIVTGEGRVKDLLIMEFVLN